MHPKPFFVFLLFAGFELSIAILPSAACAQGKQSGRHPNIVLIVADDLGYGDFSCYGATKISTPAVDKLASAGMRFTDFYVSSSLCSPSRYSILTGSYSWRTRLKQGVLPFFARPLIQNNETTIASLLKRNGYYTACVGKWHLGLGWALKNNAPADPGKTVFNSWSIKAQDYIDFSRPVKDGPTTRGFDYFYGIAGSLNMLPFVFIENNKVVQPPRDSDQPVHAYDQKSLEAPDWDPETVNQVLTRKAVQVINDHFAKHTGQPLFLYFPASAIHLPCLPTFTRGKSRAGLRGDMVAEFDWSVKEVVSALKKNKAFKNTLLIVMSDNGPRPGDPVRALEEYRNSNSGLRDDYLGYFDNYKPQYINPNGNKTWQAGWLTYGHKASGELLGFKTDAWEGGLRVPFIVHWPGRIKRGQVNNTTVCATDLMATLAELTGDSLGKGEGGDSYSFYKNLKNNELPQVRTSAVLVSGGSGAFVVREGDWKYIEASAPKWARDQTYYPNGPAVTQFQLYDLKKDVAEKNNLYPRMPGKAAELKAIIDKVKQQTGMEDK